MRALCLTLLALVLTGCPKQVERGERVAGTDDSRIDAVAAQLEELRVREQSESLTCADRCALATQTCAVSDELCALVEAHPDRGDLPPRCVQSREQCAQTNASCRRCGER
jgi:hypothetical protein